MTTMNAASAPLISSDALRAGGKILFIAHLALGDFTYLQNFFAAFHRTYPQVEVHLWVDEVRRTDDAKAWPFLEKYSLYDWVESCPFFAKVYRRTYSPALLQESIAEARAQAYPIVVSLATLRPQFYAGLARDISGKGFVAGMRPTSGLSRLMRMAAFRKLDAAVDPDPPLPSGKHISDVYASWFAQLFGASVLPESRYPFVAIPAQWREWAQRQIDAWDARDRPLVFLNAFAKTRKRCWPLEKIAVLAQAMHAQPAWRDACFIVNAVPQEVDSVRRFMAQRQLPHVQVFTAEENFFQLPAVLARCSLIVSVETAVMHLANAVHVPVIALMRTKNPEWVPIDRENSVVITTQKRRDWVKEIELDAVMVEATRLALVRRENAPSA